MPITCIRCYRAAGMLEGHQLGCPVTRRALSDDELEQALKAMFREAK